MNIKDHPKRKLNQGRFSFVRDEDLRTSRRRPIPRPFSFPWGEGQVVEEVAFRGMHHEPCIQLLEFSDGQEIVRLCSYTLGGRFERNSWIAGREELAGLTTGLAGAPRLREILRKLAR